MLDSILSTAYYNHQALTLIKSLISGGMTSELEIILAEGAGLQPGFTCKKILEKCNRARLGQIALTGTPLGCLFHYITVCKCSLKYCIEKLGEGKYEDLFIAALRYHGMLCIGLYRYLDLDSDPASRTSRYVITNPPGTFDLHPTDKIFVFMPYE